MNLLAMKGSRFGRDQATAVIPEGFAPRPCPLCGDDRAVEVFTTVDYNQGFPGLFRFVRCRRCDMTYQSPCTRSDAIMALYPKEYVTPAVYTPSQLERRIFPPVHRRRAEIIEARVPIGSLLEIGCGGGFFAKFMEQRGWRTAGIEASADNVEYARGRLGLQGVHQGLWPPVGCLPPSVDVVVMAHLIEHLPDPVQALDTALRVIAPGGLLMLETPNVDSWPFRLFGGVSVSVEAPRHLSLFSKATLGDCVRRAGFEVCDLVTHSPSTIEYSVSLRYRLQSYGLRRAEKKWGGPPRCAGGEQGKPPGRNRSIRSLAKSLLHRVEDRSYAAANALADRKGVGNNLLMVARPIKIPRIK